MVEENIFLVLHTAINTFHHKFYFIQSGASFSSGSSHKLSCLLSSWKRRQISMERDIAWLMTPFVRSLK